MTGRNSQNGRVGRGWRWWAVGAVGMAGVAANLAETRRANNQTRERDRLAHDRELAEQLANRYTAAVAQLGSDTLEVRLGGLYALEKIAADSEAHHRTVEEVLSAFVREHATPGRPGVPRRDRRTLPTPAERAAGIARRTPARLDTDVQAALTVLGRLPDRDDAADADGGGADGGGADGGGGADLTGADLTGAHLTGADLTDADLTDAHLTDADVTDAWLGLANLTRARLDRANLAGAWLYGANLTGAFLGEANLTGARLDGADLAGAQGLTQEQVDAAHGDTATRLPEAVARPAAWPAEDADPDPPLPPPPPLLAPAVDAASATQVALPSEPSEPDSRPVADEPSVTTASALRLVTAGRTRRGNRRGPNEDAFVIADGLLAVADGVGGEPAGQIASTLAVTTVAQSRAQYATDPGDALLRAVERANKVVREKPKAQPKWHGMACTLDVVVLGRRPETASMLIVAHIGDCSVWLQPSKGRPRILTVPHAIKNGPLLNAVGIVDEVTVDLVSEPVKAGDRVVLASDGITKVLTPDQLDGLMSELGTEPPERALDALMDAAMLSGARDDTTIIVADLVPDRTIR